MRMLRAVAIGLLAVTTACTVPVRSDRSDTSSATTSTLPNAPAGGTVVVTIPGLSAAVATTTAGSTPSGSATTPPPPTVAVTLTGCPACTVVATHAGVGNGFTAALLAAGQGRAVLVAVRGDGSTGAAVNVTYGATFPTPTGGELPCDDDRCVVVGLRTDGHAVASAWQLTSAGSWTDVSIDGGFVSSTATARTVDLDGGLGIAIQLAGTVWSVYAWQDGRYQVVGCGPDPAGTLTVDACPS